MKAAVVVTPGTIEIQDVPDPAPGPSEVVVKPATVGIWGPSKLPLTFRAS